MFSLGADQNATSWHIFVMSAIVFCIFPDIGWAREAREEFLRDYRGPAAEVYQAYSHIRLKYRGFQGLQDGKILYDRESVEGVISPDGWKLTEKGRGNDGIQITARNKDYQFTLTPTERGRVLSALESAGEGDRSIFLCAHTDTALGRPYLAAVVDPKYTPISYTDEVFQDKSCKAYRHRMTITHPGTGLPSTFERAYYFAHRDGWVCLGFRDWDLKGMVWGEDRHTYRPLAAFPVPALATVQRWAVRDVADGRLRLCFGIDVESINEQTVTPESELRLSGYGMSEPELPKKPAGVAWLWYLTAGGFLLSLVLFIFLVRRSIQKART